MDILGPYLVILCIGLLPAYCVYKVIQSLCKSKVGFLSSRALLNSDVLEFFNMLVIGAICIFGLWLDNNATIAGEPLIKHDRDGQVVNSYMSLSSEHILTIAILFAMGIMAYYILKYLSKSISPIIYVICCSSLILNIVFTGIYFIHTSGKSDIMYGSGSIRYGFACLSLIYLAQLKNSMDEVRILENNQHKEFKSNTFSRIYMFFIKYETKPMFWIVIMFPVLIIIQLILVLFGQKPDSFIQVFFETSSYNYSKVIAPDPIVVPGDGHYLCTVSAEGHEKIVKPVRGGIRHGRRVIVNRQLMVANAFENVLEEYTPKIHKIIRYIYDKYGYPLSKHINTKLSADIVYILMKPLEWIFLIVLYSVDRNPENRINIQYSELRK